MIGCFFVVILSVTGTDHVDVIVGLSFRITKRSLKSINVHIWARKEACREAHTLCELERATRNRLLLRVLPYGRDRLHGRKASRLLGHRCRAIVTSTRSISGLLLLVLRKRRKAVYVTLSSGRRRCTWNFERRRDA